MPSPSTFLAHLREHGYNSRSDKHSNALAQAILDDLITHCPKVRAKAAAGALVYDLNFTLIAAHSEWNVDLVLGAPPLGNAPPEPGTAITRMRPSSVEVAVELKAVMTEHRKAVKNRKRDLEAHHEHVHNYNNQTVAGGVLIINAAPTFKSILRLGPTTHRNPSKLVEHCISELRSVATRGGPTGYGLEARCAVVVDMDNINLATTCYLDRPPAPQVGHPLHYDAFVQALCAHYSSRF